METSETTEETTLPEKKTPTKKEDGEKKSTPPAKKESGEKKSTSSEKKTPAKEEDGEKSTPPAKDKKVDPVVEEAWKATLAALMEARANGKMPDHYVQVIPLSEDYRGVFSEKLLQRYLDVENVADEDFSETE